MADIVRYKHIAVEWQDGPGVFMDDVPEGHWVKYEDHKKIVDELKEQLRETQLNLDLLDLQVSGSA